MTKRTASPTHEDTTGPPPTLATIGVGFMLGVVVAISLLWLGSEAGAWWALAGVP